MTNEELLEIIQEAAKKKVKKLDLSFQGLTFLPAEIGQLTNLTQLYLRGNQLSSLPAEIGQLANLTELYVSSNQLRSLPAEIGQLTNLTQLYLRYNRLSNLPTEIGQLTNLTLLNLWYNQLKSLPVEIGQLANLTQLDLGENQLSNLPAEIGQLTKLKFLDISVNQIVKLPPELDNTDLSSFNYEGNPLIDLPPEIRNQGFRAVLYFYKQYLEQETDKIYEAKLIILGEAGAGKTTLSKKIQNENYQLQDEESTQGIDVIQWKFQIDHEKEFQVNIWDFGGQEIYHATHQFFLTKRSLYILVADSRKEDTDFYYWLNVVELLSDNSPLLIVRNEKQDRKREINERQLRGEFTNLKETLATNLSTNRGLADIIKQIKQYIQNLPHVGTEPPKNWIKVREALEKDPRDYISLEEYLKICQENGFTTQEDKLFLSSYLHDLGVCLHFQEDELLRRTVILKPTWGTDAVYKVLDNSKVIENLGQFNRQDLEQIWQEDKYANMRPELLRLMMNFKLCYEIPNRPGKYIAPQLLSPDQSDYNWDETDNLLLRYEYEFMPKGILTRFIVEIHHWIAGQKVWRTGVVLSKDKAQAEVIELYHKREIRIRVSGKRKRDLLANVRHELDNIHLSYERLKYKTLVPCNCDTCKGNQAPNFYTLQILYKFLDDQRYIQCQNSYEMVDVRSLIDDMNIERPRKTHQSRQYEAITEDEPRSYKPMPQNHFHINNPEIVQITDQNLAEVIGKKYASDPNLQTALNEIMQILNNLQVKHPNATEQEAEEIIEAEFKEIQTQQPNKWQKLRRQLLNPERWFNGGKSALSKAAEHFADNNVFYKAGLGFLDGFSADDEDI